MKNYLRFQHGLKRLRIIDFEKQFENKRKMVIKYNQLLFSK